MGQLISFILAPFIALFNFSVTYVFRPLANFLYNAAWWIASHSVTFGRYVLNKVSAFGISIGNRAPLIKKRIAPFAQKANQVVVYTIGIVETEFHAAVKETPLTLFEVPVVMLKALYMKITTSWVPKLAAFIWGVITGFLPFLLLGIGLLLLSEALIYFTSNLSTSVNTGLIVYDTIQGIVNFFVSIIKTIIEIGNLLSPLWNLRIRNSVEYTRIIFSSAAKGLNLVTGREAPIRFLLDDMQINYQARQLGVDDHIKRRELVDVFTQSAVSSEVAYDDVRRQLQRAVGWLYGISFYVSQIYLVAVEVFFGVFLGFAQVLGIASIKRYATTATCCAEDQGCCAREYLADILEPILKPIADFFTTLFEIDEAFIRCNEADLNKLCKCGRAYNGGLYQLAPQCEQSEVDCIQRDGQYIEIFKESPDADEIILSVGETQQLGCPSTRRVTMEVPRRLSRFLAAEDDHCVQKCYRSDNDNWLLRVCERGGIKYQGHCGDDSSGSKKHLSKFLGKFKPSLKVKKSLMKNFALDKYKFISKPVQESKPKINTYEDFRVKFADFWENTESSFPSLDCDSIGKYNKDDPDILLRIFYDTICVGGKILTVFNQDNDEAGILTKMNIVKDHHKPLRSLLEAHQEYHEKLTGSKSRTANLEEFDKIEEHSSWFANITTNRLHTYHRGLREKTARILRAKTGEGVDQTEDFGVFGPECAYLCYDGVTCVEPADKQLCPQPKKMYPGMYFRQFFQYLSMGVEYFDFEYLVTSVFSCWEGLEQNPETDPTTPGNVGKMFGAPRGSESLGLTYCFPMIPRVSTIPYFTYSLRDFLREECGETFNIVTESFLSACRCPQYYINEDLFDQQEWFIGLPLFIKYRFANFATFVRYMITRFDFVRDWVNPVWKYTGQWLFYEWSNVYNFFESSEVDGGLNDGQNLFCILVTLGSIIQGVLALLVLWVVGVQGITGVYTFAVELIAIVIYIPIASVLNYLSLKKYKNRRRYLKTI